MKTLRRRPKYAGFGTLCSILTWWVEEFDSSEVRRTFYEVRRTCPVSYRQLIDGYIH
jgi:hypothetical protein